MVQRAKFQMKTKQYEIILQNMRLDIFVQLFHKEKMHPFTLFVIIFVGLVPAKGLIESEYKECRWQKQSEELLRWALGLQQRGKCTYSLQQDINGYTQILIMLRKTQLLSSQHTKLTCSLMNNTCTFHSRPSQNGTLSLTAKSMVIQLPSNTYIILQEEPSILPHMVMMAWILIIIVYFGRRMDQPPTHVFLLLHWLLGVLGMGFLVLDGVMGFHDDHKYIEVAFLTLSITGSLVVAVGILEKHDEEHMKPFLQRVVQVSTLNALIFLCTFGTVLWVISIACMVSYLPHANQYLPPEEAPQCSPLKKAYWQNHYPIQKVLLYCGFFLTYSLTTFSYPPTILLLLIMIINIIYLYWRTKLNQPQLKTLTQSFSTSTQQCSICLESLYNSEVLITECNHMFHVECLKGWMHVNQVCPIDRNLLDQPEISWK